MEVYDSKIELLTSEVSPKTKSKSSSNKDNILCQHCKRTANNGIRCLGMCVADNDY